MITIVVGIAGLLFLLCLTFGIRAGQPLAIVASVLVLATLYCGFGYAMAAMTGSRLPAEIWLAAGAVSLVLAGLLAFTAWRRSSDSR
jgi:hypothetical protein